MTNKKKGGNPTGDLLPHGWLGGLGRGGRTSHRPPVKRRERVEKGCRNLRQEQIGLRTKQARTPRNRGV